jgi:uncharacterized membrane protein YjgN (DUF898 family)
VNTSVDDINELYPPLEAPVRRAPEPVIKTYRISFLGTASEYFKIWIVNLALTLVTLGLYLPWARVRTRQYFWGNTYLAEHSFSYLARPAAIFRGMLVLAAIAGLSQVTCMVSTTLGAIISLAVALLMPLIVWLAARFRTYNTAYRGIRFGFHGRVKGAYRAFLWWPVLGALLVFFPLMRHRQRHYLLGGLSYGGSRARFAATSGQFYRMYLRVLGFAVVIAIAWFMTMVAIFAVAAATSAAVPMDPRDAYTSMLPVVGVLLGLGFFAVRQLAAVRELNLSVEHTTLASLRLRSEVRFRSMLWIQLTNLVAMVASVGLLIPWAQCRRWKYLATHLTVVGSGELDDVVAAAHQAPSALGEAADMWGDLDLGF